MKKMKISIRLLVMTIGMLLLLQLPVLAATGKSTGDTVRIRQTPSTDSDIVDLLALGESVEILGSEGDWYKVSFKGKTGYVAKSFISTNDNEQVNNTQNNTTSNEQNENKSNQENNTAENNEVNNNENTSTSNENVASNEISSSNETAENQTNTENTEPVIETRKTANKIYKMAENSNVNILPVLTSEVIGELKADDSVTLISSAGLWVYVKSSNVSGWIRIDKLSSEDMTEEVVEDDKKEEKDNVDNTENDTNKDNTEEEKEEVVVKVDAKKMYTKVAAVNVRSSANTTSNVVDSLEINSQVTVVGEVNDWYKVEENGYVGFIRKDLLSNEKTEVSSRDNAFDRTAQTSVEVDVNASVDQAPVVQENTAVANENVATESVPVSSSGVSGTDIANYAQQFVGCSYVYGAAGPYSFDCSGLTMYVYQHFGYSLSHSSKVQATQGVAVTGDLQPGDILVFSNDGRTVGHVGIYIGNDKFVHASDSTTGVIISNLSDRWNISKYWGARRVL